MTYIFHAFCALAWINSDLQSSKNMSLKTTADSFPDASATFVVFYGIRHQSGDSGKTNVKCHFCRVPKISLERQERVFKRKFSLANNGRQKCTFGEMRIFIEKVTDEQMGARHTTSIVMLFEKNCEETFKTLAEGRRTPALWVQDYYMVDVITIFIRTEWHADHNGHLSCIVNRVQDIFSAARHHQYAKSTRLYCQMMKQLKTSS